jgi:hypothetical protein
MMSGLRAEDYFEGPSCAAGASLIGEKVMTMDGRGLQEVDRATPAVDRATLTFRGVTPVSGGDALLTDTTVHAIDNPKPVFGRATLTFDTGNVSKDEVMPAEKAEMMREGAGGIESQSPFRGCDVGLAGTGESGSTERGDSSSSGNGNFRFTNGLFHDGSHREYKTGGVHHQADVKPADAHMNGTVTGDNHRYEFPGGFETDDPFVPGAPDMLKGGDRKITAEYDGMETNRMKKNENGDIPAKVTGDADPHRSLPGAERIREDRFPEHDERVKISGYTMEIEKAAIGEEGTDGLKDGYMPMEEFLSSKGAPFAGNGLSGHVDEELLLRLREHIANTFRDNITVRRLIEGREVTMKLHPPEYGSMNIRLILKGGIASALFVVDSEEVRRMVAETLPSLHEAFSEHGIDLRDLEVFVGEDEPGFSSMKKEDETLHRPVPRERYRETEHPECWNLDGARIYCDARRVDCLV